MMKLFLTMVIVLVATWRQFGFCAAARSAWSAARDVLLARVYLSRRTPPSIRAGRIHACHRCTIHFDGLGTCGIPGDVDEDGKKIGCWCPTRTASYVWKKECWRGEAHGDSQW